MTAAVDMAVLLEQLRETVRAEMEKLRAVPSRRPLSMTPEAIRQRRCQAKKRATKVGGVIYRDQDHGTPRHDLNARAAVDLDLVEKSREARRPAKIAKATPERRTRADSDHRRELARIYRGFGEVAGTYAGADYPQPAPWTEQRAARLLLQERGVNATLKAAVEFCRRWSPTREHGYPTLALLRFKLLEDEHRKQPSSSPSPRPPAAPATREGPQPRIWPGDLRRSRPQDVPRQVGTILEQLARREPKP